MPKETVKKNAETKPVKHSQAEEGNRAGAESEVIPRSYNRGGSQRFEMFLPPGLVEDLNLMKEKTGNSFAAYIRAATVRALAEDKKRWGQ